MKLKFIQRILPFIYLLQISLTFISCSNVYNKYLLQAGENKTEIEKAIESAPDKQKEGLHFLLENMPKRDLKVLSSKFILENLNYSYKILNEVKWVKEIPKEIFFNYILPYSNINERRDNWRKDFYERFYSLIKEKKSLSSAALYLNKTIWDSLNVKYSTKRPKADQSPYETIDAGLASCTGLSILFIDVCRSVGIPARFVGIPLWKDKTGNHSWVEIWDNGWHYLGAAENSELNKTWFTERAASADDSEWRHSIYAVSYKKTNVIFPPLFDTTATYIFADIVTDRYNKKIKDDENINFGIRVFKNNSRVTADVKLLQNGNVLLNGKSKDENHDYNDFLTFNLLPKNIYEVFVKYNGNEKREVIKLNSDKYQFLNINLP